MGYSIAMFGAFNVWSFGDTLFPKALYLEMSKYISIDRLEIFSLGGGISGYLGERKVHSYDEFETLNKEAEFDAIIIGGGELLHEKEIHFDGGNIVYAPGDIWKIPINYGRKYNIPIILNSVGMPYELQEDKRKEYLNLFSYVSYISLRDRFSFERWKDYFGDAIRAELVPDSLWCIKDYFDKESIIQNREFLKNKYNCTDRYLVLQYGTSKEYEQVVKIIERFAENINISVIVLAINSSHEDKFVVEHLDSNNDRTIIISDILSPDEIIPLISGAEMFIGTSLHGNLTALAYGVKNVIIDMYPEFISKLDGFSSMIGNECNFVGEIQDLWDILVSVYENTGNTAKKVENLRISTQNHYAKICEIVKSGNREIYFSKTLGEDKNRPLKIRKWTPMFQKGYFKVYHRSGRREIYKTIERCTNDIFTFSFKVPDKKRGDIVSFTAPLSSFALVTVQDEKKWIVEKNAVDESFYMPPVLNWRLNDSDQYSLMCKFSNASIEIYTDAICRAYKNQYIYAEQMLLKEREYLNVIESNYQKLKIIKGKNKKLEFDIIKNNKVITDLKQKRIDLQKELSNSQKEFSKLQQEILNLEQQIFNKNEHIEILLSAERELTLIRKSSMFKIMRFICRGVDIFVFIPKLLVKNIFAFIKMMTHVNRQELKIAWGYVKNEGLTGAYRHLMRDYHQGELKPIHVEVEKKIYDEIKDIQSCAFIELPLHEKPLVSIVIPAYNQFTYTYYCIKSIAENSGDVAYEVILADDCSNDLTTQIADVVKNLIIARTEQNLLFLRNCNQAAKYAKGKYILFLNNDTQVQKDWLRPLTDLCESDSTIGMTGSKLVYADGTLQEAGGIIWKDGSGWNYGRNDDAMKPEYNYVRDVDYISGAAIMIRRSLWESLGGFDERFVPAYCEDSDLAFMVRKAGYRVVYQPASVVAHYEGKSNGTDLTSGVKKYQIENSIKLKEKWKDEFAKQYENAQCVFKARERSRDKKVILVIDHYVPQFDKDAGSKTTFQYLKMFVKKGYSVKFIGDNFYQDEPYTSMLQQMGIEVLYGPWYAEHWKEWILENKKYIDFAYLNRPHITIKYIDFLKENTDIKCIYYGHDLHFLRLRREYELTGQAEKLQESKEWMEKELYIMRKADISHYPSYVEEEEIHKIDPDIKVKAITAYVYEKFQAEAEKDFTKREGIVFVGGFGHPPNEDAVLWFAHEIYPLVLEKLDVPFYIVGSKPTEAIKKLASEKIIVKGFVSEEELSRMYRDCKLVVVPLRYGAGVKGKVVEALYYGTPMVTTPVGTEGIQGVQDMIEVAEKAEDFAKAVVELYQDNERLAKTADDYQKYIKNNFSVEAVWKVIEDDFS